MGRVKVYFVVLGRVEVIVLVGVVVAFVEVVLYQTVKCKFEG